MPAAFGTISAMSILVALSTLPAQAQEVDPSTTRLLEYSEVRSILGGFHDGIGGTLASRGIELTPEQDEVLSEALSVETLLPIMRHQFERLGDSEIRAAAAALVRDGALAQVESAVDAQPPSTTIEEYLAELEREPPPQARVRLVSDVIMAQAAGAFYVLLEERTREAAHRIVQALETSSEPFEPISEEEWVARAEQGHLQALVSFLHRYENVPDDLMRSSLDEWNSDPGSWFVEAYSRALGETLLAAADTVANTLKR